MSATDLFHEARLTEALTAQQNVVAASPDDVGERLLLCEFLAYAGRRDDARTQLAAIPRSAPMIADYLDGWLQLLAADEARHAGTGPKFLLDPPEHIAARLAALKRHDASDIQEMDDRAAWLEGHVDGREFDGWRDTDDVLSVVLEVFVSSEFLWVPLEQIRKLRFGQVEVLRDSLYRPATLWLTDRQRIDVYVPSLYVDTATHPEDGLRIGAGVDWVERDGLMRGVGAKAFLFGEEELAIDEFRQVEVRLS